MKITEYKQIDTEVIENTILVDDIGENGEVIGQHEEVIRKEVPIMSMVTRDMTEEEVRAFEEEQKNIPPIEPTFEDRIEAQVMFTALMTDTLLEEGDM